MTGEVRAAGYSQAIGDPVEFVSRLRDESAKLGASVEAYDAGIVLGAEHLVVAWELARRSFGNGRAVADSVAMEARLYLSCEGQIKVAMAKTGVKKGSAVALVSDSAESLELAAKALGLTRDDTVLEATPEKLAAWGFTGLPGAVQARDLIFERMALAEVER